MTAGAPSTPIPLRLALVLGGTTTVAAVLDPSGRIVSEQTFPTPAGGSLMESCRRAADRRAFMEEHWTAFLPVRESLLDRACAALERAVREATAHAGGRPAGVGISAPGAVHPYTGDVSGRYGALNMPAWGAFNIRAAVERRTGLPARAVNDAKAMALGSLARMEREVLEVRFPDRRSSAESGGEVRLGAAGRRVRDFIELDPGTGLGGAYVVAGRLWFGPDPARPDPEVGEVWKLHVDPDHPGRDFEDLASGRATLARAETLIRRALPREGTSILRAAEGKIQALLRCGRPPVVEAATRALEDTGRSLARGMKVLMTREAERIHAPPIRCFVIGGGLVSGTAPEARRVRRVLARAIFRELEGFPYRPRVLFCPLGSRAAVYGAASLVSRHPEGECRG